MPKKVIKMKSYYDKQKGFASEVQAVNEGRMSWVLAEGSGRGDESDMGNDVARHLSGTPTKDTIRSSQALPIEQAFNKMYGPGQILEPPYSPYKLMMIAEESVVLSDCLQAMENNIGQSGYELVPKFELEEGEEPSEEAMHEKSIANRFYRYGSMESSLGKLRKELTSNRERVGYGCWEIMRNYSDELSGVRNLRSYMVRLAGLSNPMVVETEVVEPISMERFTVSRWKQFFKFLMFDGVEYRFFKELGDPRHLNSRTGQWSSEPWGVDQLTNVELEANEIYYWPIYCPWSDYGVPRWTPGVHEIRSLYQLSRLIYLWFKKGCIGTYIAACSNGEWGPKSQERMKQVVDSYARGVEKAFSIVFLDAFAGRIGQGGAASLVGGNQPSNQVSIQRLDDSLNIEMIKEFYPAMVQVVRSLFLLPAVYIGHTEDYNRSTVVVAQQIANEQIFGPICKEFDDDMNDLFFPLMGIHHWTFRTKMTKTTNDIGISDAVKWFWDSGIGSPNAAIRLFNDMTGLQLNPIEEDWGDMPWAVAQLAAQGSALGVSSVATNPDDLKKKLNQIAVETKAKGMWNDKSIIQESFRIGSEVQRDLSNIYRVLKGRLEQESKELFNY